MGSFLVREYLTQEGESPYRGWLLSLDKTVRARIQARVMRFEGDNLGDSKPVGDGVWEARLMFGPGYQVYFGLDDRTVLLLLLGGNKRTQGKDIRQAQQYWDDYCKRGKNGEAR
jgi:putative addiction module killer protein